MKTNLVLWVGAAMIGGIAVNALCVTHPKTPAKTVVSSVVAKNENDDAGFVKEAVDRSMFEVEIGKLALKKAISTQVQEFAKMMVDDHTNVKTDLKALATQKKIVTPGAITQSQQQQLTALMAKSGQEFDRQYLSYVRAEHQKTVDSFKKAAENAKDTEIKAFAAKTLPRMLYHLEMIDRLEKLTADSN